MSNENGNTASSSKTSDLDQFEQRLGEAQKKHAKDDTNEGANSFLGMAWRISTELVVATVIGCAFGFGIDYLTGTKPIFTIIGLVLGIAAGLKNTFRLAYKMEADELERLRKLDES